MIKDLRFHDLRHTGISMLFWYGFKIEEVALVSGHKNWHTLRRYTHMTGEVADRELAHTTADPQAAVTRLTQGIADMGKNMGDGAGRLSPSSGTKPSF